MMDLALEIQLCYDKLSGNSDLDWEEIKEMTNFEHSVAHLKNLAYGYKRLIDSNYLGNIDSGNETESDEKLIEIRKEITKLSVSKIETNKLLREQAKKDLFAEQIRDAVIRLAPPEFQEIAIQEYNESHVLHLSDVHYGSAFEVEANKYDIEICVKRMNKLLAKTVKKIKKDGISKLKVINTGDSIQGMLRMSDIKKNEVPVVESVVGFSQLMSRFLNDLSAHVEVEYYHVTSANHSEPRFIGSSAGQMPEEDFEKIIINYIHDTLIGNERVMVHLDINKAFIELDLAGFKSISVHGHNINNVNTAIRDLSMTNRTFYNYLIMGHVHHTKIQETDSDCMVLVAPSFVGVCPYSKKILKTSNPGANFYTFEENEGLTNVAFLGLKGVC